MDVKVVLIGILITWTCLEQSAAENRLGGAEEDTIDSLIDRLDKLSKTEHVRMKEVKKLQDFKDAPKRFKNVKKTGFIRKKSWSHIGNGGTTTKTDKGKSKGKRR